MLFWLRKRIRWKPEGIDSSLPPIRKAINPSTMMRMLIPDLFIQQRPASCAASTLINWISTHVGLRKRELFHNDDSFFPHIFILIYDSSIRSSLSPFFHHCSTFDRSSEKFSTSRYIKISRIFQKSSPSKFSRFHRNFKFLRKTVFENILSNWDRFYFIEIAKTCSWILFPTIF